jgi:hypothetical protein
MAAKDKTDPGPKSIVWAHSPGLWLWKSSRQRYRTPSRNSLLMSISTYSILALFGLVALAAVCGVSLGAYILLALAVGQIIFWIIICKIGTWMDN